MVWTFKAPEVGSCTPGLMDGAQTWWNFLRDEPTGPLPNVDSDDTFKVITVVIPSVMKTKNRLVSYLTLLST